MFSSIGFRWLVGGVCLVVVSGCGNSPARVLGPGDDTQVTTTRADRVGSAFGVAGELPCDPAYAGPVFTLSGPGFEYVYPSGGVCPSCPGAEVPVDVPENQPVTFEWSADASGGCTDILWYRWALDIEDLFDETPRTDEATDLAHWSVRSLGTSVTVGPFTLVPGTSNVHRLYIEAADRLGYVSLAILRITVVEAVNRPPDVQAASARLLVDGPPDGGLSPVAIEGVTDPDGDAVSIAVIGITQDEPLLGRGVPPTCPDGWIDGGVGSVRRERSGTGNGRVYTVEFLASDGRGGAAVGTAEVCIPRGGSSGGCVRDPLVVNSLETCDPAAHGGPGQDVP